MPVTDDFFSLHPDFDVECAYIVLHPFVWAAWMTDERFTKDFNRFSAEERDAGANHLGGPIGTYKGVTIYVCA